MIKLDKAAACIMVTVVLSLWAVVMIQPAAAEETKTFTGTVYAYTEEDGSLWAVELTTDDEDVYSIVLDKTGRELGQKMDGKRVIVTGTVKEDDYDMWITVKSYKAAPENPKGEPTPDAEEEE